MPSASPLVLESVGFFMDGADVGDAVGVWEGEPDSEIVGDDDVVGGVEWIDVGFAEVDGDAVAPSTDGVDDGADDGANDGADVSVPLTVGPEEKDGA